MKIDVQGTPGSGKTTATTKRPKGRMQTTGDLRPVRIITEKYSRAEHYGNTSPKSHNHGILGFGYATIKTHHHKDGDVPHCHLPKEKK